MTWSALMYFENIQKATETLLGYYEFYRVHQNNLFPCDCEFCAALLGDFNWQHRPQQIQDGSLQ